MKLATTAQVDSHNPGVAVLFTNDCVASAWRRFGARQNGLRPMPPTSILVRDAELAAHAEFRKHLWLRRWCPRCDAPPRQRSRNLFRRLHDRHHLAKPVFRAISPTRLNSARISAAVCSGVA